MLVFRRVKTSLFVWGVQGAVQAHRTFASFLSLSISSSTLLTWRNFLPLSSSLLPLPFPTNQRLVLVLCWEIWVAPKLAIPQLPHLHATCARRRLLHLHHLSRYPMLSVWLPQGGSVLSWCTLFVVGSTRKTKTKIPKAFFWTGWSLPNGESQTYLPSLQPWRQVDPQGASIDDLRTRPWPILKRRFQVTLPPSLFFYRSP